MSALPAESAVISAKNITLELNDSYFRRTWWEWVFAALVIAGGVFAFARYHSAMDVYEKGILLGAIPCTI